MLSGFVALPIQLVEGGQILSLQLHRLHLLFEKSDQTRKEEIQLMVWSNSLTFTAVYAEMSKFGFLDFHDEAVEPP